MQTFICDYDLAKNAALLDNKRLFKQLLEGKQILDVLVNNKKSWSNHPAVLQWKGYTIGLFLYLDAIWKELQKRNIAIDSKLFEQCEDLTGIKKRIKNKEPIGEPGQIFPDWWKRADILESHRSRLKCKGLVDSYCDSIKKHFKIKNIDSWLKKEARGKTKNQLRYSDMRDIQSIAFANNIKPGKNYYDIAEWKKIPYDLEIIWPK